MARSYANIVTAIWRDKDFLALPVNAQHMYLLLATQEDISAAGLLALRLQRWAKLAKGLTRAKVVSALDVLIERRFVLIDEHTEELLIRTFIKADNGYKNANRLGAIRDSVSAIMSETLREAVADELEKLGLTRLAEQARGRASQGPSDGLPTPSQGASSANRVVVTKDPLLVPTTPNPQTTTLVPSHGDQATRRGSRIAENWTPTVELVQWAREQNIPDSMQRHELAKFIDYWAGKAGKDGVKSDWPATWRNWLRNAVERTPNPRKPQGTADARVSDHLSIAAKLRDEETA